jgi:hypothetical protein
MPTVIFHAEYADGIHVYNTYTHSYPLCPDCRHPLDLHDRWNICHAEGCGYAPCSREFPADEETGDTETIKGDTP